jgi:hypothetical protein
LGPENGFLSQFAVVFASDSFFSKKISKSTKNDPVKKVLLIFSPQHFHNTQPVFIAHFSLQTGICIIFLEIRYPKFCNQYCEKKFLHFWRLSEKIIGCGMKDDAEQGSIGLHILITRF